MPRDLAGRKGYYRYGHKVDEAVDSERRAFRKRMMDRVGEGGDDVFDVYRRDFTDWDDQTQDDRDESIVARDFYDGIQWTDEEVDKLNQRKQPILTTNLIKPKINFILGSEAANPVTFKARPRTNMHDQDSDVATDALHAAADITDLKMVRRAVAANTHIEGYGGAVLYVDEFENADPEIRLEHVEWDRMYYDPRSRKPDFSDAQYMGIIVWMHREEAEEEFLTDDMSQADKDDIMAVLQTSYARDQTSGDASQDAPRRWRDGGDRVQFFETYRKIEGVWTKAIWSWGGWIQEPEAVGGMENGERWGFVDDNGETFCPLIATSAFVNRDNARYGLVHDMRSPQEEINKRKSKALHLIHTKPVIAEVGALQNPDEFAAELTKPDGVGQVMPGRLKDGSIQVMDNTQMAQAQFQMMDHAVSAVNAIGPHAALVAADQRVQSGAAFTARQQAGAMEIKPVTDNLDQWTIKVGRAMWYLIRVHWSHEMWIRVRDDELHKGHRFVALNRKLTKGERVEELVEMGWPAPEAIQSAMGAMGMQLLQRLSQEAQKKAQKAQAEMQEMQQLAEQTGLPMEPQKPPPDPMKMLLDSPMAQQPFTENDIAKLDVDITIELEPTTPAVREAQFMELLKLLQTTVPNIQNEELKLGLIGEMFRNSDLRADMKQRFVQMLAPKPPSEQEQQAQQMQMQQMQMQLQTMQSQMEKLQSETAKNQAQAQKLAIEAAQAIPATAQLNVAKTDQVVAETHAIPSEVKLTEAQARSLDKETEEGPAEDNNEVPFGTRRT